MPPQKEKLTVSNLKTLLEKFYEQYPRTPAERRKLITSHLNGIEKDTELTNKKLQAVIQALAGHRHQRSPRRHTQTIKDFSNFLDSPFVDSKLTSAFTDRIKSTSKIDTKDALISFAAKRKQFKEKIPAFETDLDGYGVTEDSNQYHKEKKKYNRERYEERGQIPLLRVQQVQPQQEKEETSPPSHNTSNRSWVSAALSFFSHQRSTPSNENNSLEL